MPTGAGKYDDVCTEARLATHGEAVVLAVVNGDRGSGFSVQCEGYDPAAALPTLLRNLADEIERSLSTEQ